MRALVCATCGTPSVPGARFCHVCGAALERVPDVDTAAERRLVTVLFGDLSDFTAWAEDLDPERVGVVTDRVLAALAEAVTEVGGHVDKLTGDGIMAVFGAPVAHEDDAERGVRAAARMQDAVRRLLEEEIGGGRRLGLRVGLNTGEVLAGIQAHLAYTVVGDTVNTAARLADAAGIGTVLAGRETVNATTTIASWRTLPPLRLKGKREPVPAYELVGLRHPGAARLGVGVEVPFVGRDAELGHLVGRLMDVAERGRPATELITGEAGIGKTRLVTELSRFAGELPDARVLWSRCPPYGDSRDLAPLAQWVRVAVGAGELEPADRLAARIRRVVGRLEAPAFRGTSPATTIERLATLLGVAGADGPLHREAATPGSAAIGADPALAAVSSLLRGLALDGPMVLVLDDTQWASPRLRAALQTVGGELAGSVLLLLVGRSDLSDADWVTGLPEPQVLPLVPLDDAAAERLLRAYLGGAELAADARELLLSRARGNPFFLAELLRLLVDRGILRRSDSGWRLVGDVPSDVLPAGVQAVLAARVDALEPAAKAVLRDAAVFGVEFPPEALAAFSAIPGDLPAVIDTLISRGIVVSAGPGMTSYVFAHPLVRDVVYAAIPKAERARQHARLASWISEHRPVPIDDPDAIAAGQAEQAIALAREMRLPAEEEVWSVRRIAFAALTRLGRAALLSDDNIRAESYLARALSVAADTVDAALQGDAGVWRAEALVRLGRLADAEEALGLALASGDGALRASALVVLGELRRRRGEDAPARQALVTGVALASEAGADRVTGAALRQLGLLDYLAGRLPAAEEHFRQAMELADRIGDRRGVGWALQHLAWSATTRGAYDEAETFLLQAGDVFTDLDDGGGLSWCAGTEAFVRLMQGRLREARELAGALLPIGEALGERWGVAACLTIDAFAAAELGDVEQATREADSAYSVFTELGDTWGQAMALTALGAAARFDGRLADAVRAFERGVECSDRAAHPATLALTLTALGWAQLDSGERVAAVASARRALSVLESLGLAAHVLVGAQVLLAQGLRATGETEEGIRLLAAAAEAVDVPSLLFPRRQALAHYAEALLQAGDLDRAMGVAERAVSVPAEDVRSRALALLVLAECYRARGDETAAQTAVRQAHGAARIPAPTPSP